MRIISNTRTSVFAFALLLFSFGVTSISYGQLGCPPQKKTFPALPAPQTGFVLIHCDNFTQPIEICSTLTCPPYEPECCVGIEIENLVDPTSHSWDITSIEILCAEDCVTADGNKWMFCGGAKNYPSSSNYSVWNVNRVRNSCLTYPVGMTFTPPTTSDYIEFGNHFTFRVCGCCKLTIKITYANGSVCSYTTHGLGCC